MKRSWVLSVGSVFAVLACAVLGWLGWEYHQSLNVKQQAQDYCNGIAVGDPFVAAKQRAEADGLRVVDFTSREGFLACAERYEYLPTVACCHVEERNGRVTAVKFFLD